MAVQMQQTRTNRQASPERWQRAAERALANRIEVRQVNANGMWTASSGSEPKVAYMLEITAGVVRSCSCPAGDFSDPCCQHSARYYLDAGLLDPDDDPEGPAPAAVAVATVRCLSCQGGKIEEWGVSGVIGWTSCDVCEGAGTRPVPQRPAERIAA